MSYVVWVVWALVCAALAQDDPYCSVRYERLCQGKGPHVACQYPIRGAGPFCENYTSIIFSNDLKQFILHYINRRRQKIASGHERVRGGVHLPKPEIMMLVQWDRELAYLAQRLADQCQFVHDDCRATVRYPYAGQTVGEVRWRRSGTSLERGARRAIGRVFDAWWGERRRVHAKQLISPFVLTARGAVWGHFSQLAVWTLRAMGCGAVHHGATRPRLLLVCDFSHTNMLGQRTISPGPLGSCPPHTMRSGRPYPLLCAPPPVHSKQVIHDDGAGDDEIGEDESEEGEDESENEESEEEEVETKRNTITEGSDDPYRTRPWPNRPVRPIQDETIDTDQTVRQQYTTFKTITVLEAERFKNIDTDYQPIREHRPDIDNQRIREHNTDNQPYQPVKQYRIINTDNQVIRQYTTEETDSQPRLYKTEDTHRYVRPTQDVRPIQDAQNGRALQDDRPVQDVRPLQRERPVEDDDTDYRYIRPSNDDMENRHVEIVRTDRPTGRIQEYIDSGVIPIQGEEVNSETRPIVQGNGDLVNDIRRPMKHNMQDGEVSATPAVRVSVKYRDNPGIVFSQKLNDELNLRNLELEFHNRQSTRNRGPGMMNREQDTRNRGPERNREPQTRNRESETRSRGKETRYEQSALYRTDNYRSSDLRRKGEYKAQNGYVSRTELERGGRPFQFERRYDETKLQDMSAVIPLRKQTHAPVQATTVVVYRPTSLYSVQTEPVLRQRWMQTRIRPRRPGANALLQNIPTSNPVHYAIRVSKKASLILDKDEEEQLYHDTGFKLSTKR